MPNEQPVATPRTLNSTGKNLLLDLLPDDERTRLQSRMECVPLRRGEVLFERGQPITYAVFPLSGVVSVVIDMDQDGGTVEIGTVGNEGVVGITLMLGAKVSRRKAFLQVPGEGLRMDASAFTEEIARHGAFEELLRRYTLGYLNQVAQTAACNRLHSVEQRLCRWILMCHDKVGSTTLELTQQFLAEMLGVRRASVTVAAAKLQQAGLIRYRRGSIEVLDRERLERTSCECYAAVRREYEALLR